MEEQKLIKPREEIMDMPQEEVTESMADYEGYLNISYKAMNVDENYAWSKVKEYLNEKTILSLEIQSATKGGCIVSLEGLEGFIPASGLSLERVEDTSAFVGKEVSVQVVEVNEEEGKLVLSGKELLYKAQQEEKKLAVKKIHEGDVLEGTIDSLKDYGAFVLLPCGVTGLLHISQISAKRVFNIRAALKEGQTVRVLVTKIEGEKISLSIRALEEAEEEKRKAEEPTSYSDGEEANTALGDLLKGLKF